MVIKNVILIGASGNLGKIILPELIKSDLNVTAVTRPTSSATFPDGVNVVKSSLTLASLTELFQGQDAVISMIPITALGEQGVVIEAAIVAGVKRFIPSEFGSDSSSSEIINAVPFFEGKRKYLEYLQSKTDVISYTAIFTGPFFDWSFAAGLTGFNIPTKTVTLIDGGSTPFTTSNSAQIARSIIAVLKHDSITENMLVYVESFTTTQLEILAKIEEITGDKWNVVHKKSEDVRSEAFKKMAEGDLMGGGSGVILAAVLGKEALEDHSTIEGGVWNERLGLEGEDLGTELKRILEA